jgi:hypothetical protein
MSIYTIPPPKFRKMHFAQKPPRFATLAQSR